MSSPETAATLAKAVMRLLAADKPGWELFMGALADRLDETTERCISSPPETLQVHQGRAQEARDLFRELVKAPKLATGLRDKERANGSPAQPQASRP